MEHMTEEEFEELTYEEINKVCGNSKLGDSLWKTYKISVEKLNYNQVLDNHIFYRTRVCFKHFPVISFDMEGINKTVVY